MRPKSSSIPGILLVALALAASPVPAQQNPPAPEKAPLEVTYYFLPG